MVTYLKAMTGFKSKQGGLSVVEYVVGGAVLLGIIAIAVVALQGPMEGAFENMFD